MTVFDQFLKRYPHGHPIAAFKSVVAGGVSSNATPGPAPTAARVLTKVRPPIRTLISQVNDIYISVFDRDVTPSENKFWVDYVYNGEVTTRVDLIEKMRTARTIGKKPARTSRTRALSEETLERHWFSYLFYFVHHQEPSEAARAYWYSRIRPGDRDSIEKLGGTLQWLKDTAGKTHK